MNVSDYLIQWLASWGMSRVYAIRATPSTACAIHLLKVSATRKPDHQPVVAIVGQSPRAAMGGDYQ